MATGSRLGLLVVAATALADTTSFPEIGSAGSESTTVNSNFGTMARARVPERPALIDAIREAVMPVLQNLSATHNDSAWAFHYRDTDVEVGFCAGFADVVTRTPCNHATDSYAWGSTTKTQTSLAVLQLVAKGLLQLDDSIVAHGDGFLRKITNGTMSLESLYGPAIHNVTIRNLLNMESGIDEYDNEQVRLFQNTHRVEDLAPMWVLNESNRTLLCPPGTCGRYSSTNFIILGLVIGQHTAAPDWDQVDQGVWKPRDRTSSMFDHMRYAVHGPCSAFRNAAGAKGRAIHGYQPICSPPPPPPSPPRQPGPRHHHGPRRCVPANETDVYTMSCTQGWTCGNLVSTPQDVANFFFELLGPRSQTPAALLEPALLDEMLTFKLHNYFSPNLTQTYGEFGYGLGMMNFTSMDWGFSDHGIFYGHNGLTYGFGAQSGYNFDYKFAVTWVNNFEKWIGPDAASTGRSNELYDALVGVVERYRKPA